MKKSYKWCVFYMDSKLRLSIQDNLNNLGYDMKCIIPTVPLLKKRQKGKEVYEEVPIMFSYGFIKIPTQLAFNRSFLNRLKKEVGGIRGFLKSTNNINPKKLRKRVDGQDFDDFSIVATVSWKDIRKVLKATKQDIHQKDEIVNLTIGAYVTLRGYPFEGVPATIKDISLTTKTVKLELYPENGKMTMSLPLDNVAYSIYYNSDPDVLHYAHNEDNTKINTLTEDNSVFL